MSPETNRLDEIMLARRRRTMLLLVAALVLAVVVALLLTRRDDPVDEPAPEPALPTAAPATSPPPAPPMPPPAPAPRPPAASVEPEPALPALDDSDEIFRRRASALSTRLELAAWLDRSNLLRRFVASVANVAEGDSPKKQTPELAPDDPFRIVEEEGTARPDPRSYERYDTLTQVFLSLDEESAIATLELLNPLLDEAYRELGYPDGDFDRALRRALVELLSAPVVTGEPELERQIVTWSYVDPELEGLSPAQKQLLRTGPINVARIQRKLRDWALALGMSEEEIPPPRFHEPRGPSQEAGP